MELKVELLPLSLIAMASSSTSTVELSPLPSSSSSPLPIFSLVVNNVAASPVVVIIKLNISEDNVADKSYLKSQLRQLQQFMLQEFPNQKIFYQLNAKFRLSQQRADTEKVRQLSGNIFPKAFEKTAQKNCVYRRYQFQVSNRSLVLMMSEDYARPILMSNNNHVGWTFRDIVSYVVLLRIEVTQDHDFLRRFNIEDVLTNRIRYKVCVQENPTPHVCPFCNDVRFSSKWSFNHHIESVHHDETVFRCQICDSMFSTEISLKRHSVIVHKNTPLIKCQTCDFTFDTKKTMADHTASSHTNEKEFVCVICNATFSTGGSLTRHTQAVHEKALHFECILCKTWFNNKGNLRRHMKNVHKDSMHFDCRVCNTSFNTKKNLTRHINVAHKNQELVFSCFVCAAKFPSQENVTAHVLSVHQNQTPVRCPLCDATFETKDKAKMHVLRFHGTKNTFDCLTCDATFSKNSLLVTHVQTAHKDQRKEKVVSGSFPTTTTGELLVNLTKPIVSIYQKSDYFACTMCDATFGKKSELKTHVGRRHRSFACKICNTTFKSLANLKHHIFIIHNNAFLYECNVCRVKYIKKSALKRHKTFAHKRSKQVT